MVSLSFNKKGVSSYLVGIILLIVVLLVVLYSQNGKILGLAKSTLSTVELEQCESSLELCDFGCSEASFYSGNSYCEDEDLQKYNMWVSYFGQCEDSEISDDKKDSLKCGGKAHKAFEEFVLGEGSLSFEEDRGEIPSDIAISEDGVKAVLSTYDSVIERFAKENGIEAAKLKAFIMVESRGKFFEKDGKHPTVRFECTKFNKNIKDENKKVSCDTSVKKYGADSDTDYEAFKKAKDIDEELAILSSSFGIGQIMGLNYAKVGYDSPNKFYRAMFIQLNQVEAFLEFIASDVILYPELKSDNTSWEEVARRYNGENFAINNYDEKLETEYNKLKQIA